MPVEVVGKRDYKAGCITQAKETSEDIPVRKALVGLSEYHGLSASISEA